MAGRTVMQRLAFCILTATWLAIGLASYWAWWPQPSVISVHAGSAVWQTQVRAGDTVARELQFTIHKPVTLVVVRRLVEQQCVKCRVFDLQTTTRAYLAGTYKQSRAIEIPEYIPPGVYVVEADAHWQASPLRQQVVALPPYRVQVVP